MVPHPHNQSKPAPTAASGIRVHTAGGWLNWGGWLLITSGVLHVFVMLALGGEWEGSVSWRKPILFGISTGLTMVSLGWVMGKIRQAWYDHWIDRIVSVALVIEVALITFQQWRGAPSHFNNATLFDSWINHSLTVMITIAALLIFDLTRRSLGPLKSNIRSDQCLSLAPDLRRAVRGGMIYLSISCLIGFAILFLGQLLLVAGKSPETFGRGGVLKFPHGVAIHAIQLLPLVCWLMKRLSIPQATRTRMIDWLNASIGTFLLFSIVQTAMGRARFEVTLVSGLILSAALAMLIPVVRVVAQAVWKTAETRFGTTR